MIATRPTCFSSAEMQTPIEIGRANILNQRRRIEGQRDLIARFERDRTPDLVADPVRVLGQMEQALTQMEAHHSAAQEQAPKKPSNKRMDVNARTRCELWSGPGADGSVNARRANSGILRQ
jgi:hypothetical protein